MASAVARLYDSLGWFAPATLQIKILLQELRLLKLGWDDPIPTDAVVKWTAWKTQLLLLVAKPIPRCYYCNPNQIRDIQQHGFSNACTSIREPPETRKNILVATISTQETKYPLWEHYSSFTRLIRSLTGADVSSGEVDNAVTRDFQTQLNSHQKQPFQDITEIVI